MTIRQYRILRAASKKYYNYDALDEYDELDDEIEYISKELSIKKDIVNVEINNLKKLGYYSINEKHISFEYHKPTAHVTIEGYVAYCDFIKDLIVFSLRNFVIPAIVSIITALIVSLISA